MSHPMGHSSFSVHIWRHRCSPVDCFFFSRSFFLLLKWSLVLLFLLFFHYRWPILTKWLWNRLHTPSLRFTTLASSLSVKWINEANSLSWTPSIILLYIFLIVSLWLSSHLEFLRSFFPWIIQPVSMTRSLWSCLLELSLSSCLFLPLH